MAQYDLSLSALREYRPSRDEPADFDAFWQQTLAQNPPQVEDVVLVPYDSHLRLVVRGKSDDRRLGPRLP